MTNFDEEKNEQPLVVQDTGKFEFPQKNFSSSKSRAEFNSPTVKSTSPALRDTTFFAR